MVLAGDIVIHIPLLVPGKTQTSEKFVLFSQEKKACFCGSFINLPTRKINSQIFSH